MSITPDQLEKRRRLIHETHEKKTSRQKAGGNGAVESSIPPEKKWIRRGVSCERTESMLTKMARMRDVETSMTVPLSVYETRIDRCKPCKHVSERADGLLFCECCGCPKWTFRILNQISKVLDALKLGADLQSKNWHAQHVCLAEDSQFGAYEEEN